MRVLENVAQGTKEWHEWRATGIGATEASAACGASHYDTPLSIYNKKKDGFKEEAMSSPEVNSVLWAGHFVEDMLIAMFKNVHPEATNVECGKLYQHDTNNWAHASLDGECDMLGKHFILECKSIHNGKEWEDGNLPKAYLAQVMWQMYVTGYDCAVVLGCYLDGRTEHYTERWIDKANHLDFFKEVVSDTKDLRQCIINKVPPALSTTLPDVDSKELVANSSDSKTNEKVELAEDELEYYRTLKDQFDSADKALKAFKNKIMERCKDGQQLTFNGKKIGYWVSKQGAVSVDSKRLAEEMPDIFSKYSKVGNGTKYFTIR